MAWTQDTHLAAAVLYDLDVLVWQNAGKKSADRPKPTLPPPLASEAQAATARTDTRRDRYLTRRATRAHTTPGEA